MCWRTEARAAAWATLLLLLASASAQARATEPQQAPSAGATGSASAEREGCKEPLCYSASSLQAERNRMVLQDIHIVDTTRGITRITADQADANGQDLGNSEWVLTGHVQVDMPQGKLSADRATVRFVNKRIASMSAQGAPAQFEHSAAASGQDGAAIVAADATNRGHGAIESARGHAREIDYDMDRELLKLNGDSWLSDGCNEINSQSIVYDIANQKVRADAAPGGDTQVHGTLHARTGPQCGSTVSRP
ncbi:MAG: LptA/OstA family protein [Steroidobacterales bacterium]